MVGLAIQAEPQLQDELLAGVQRREQGADGFGQLVGLVVRLREEGEELDQRGGVVGAGDGVERDPGPDGRELAPGGGLADGVRTRPDRPAASRPDPGPPRATVAEDCGRPCASRRSCLGVSRTG